MTEFRKQYRDHVNVCEKCAKNALDPCPDGILALDACIADPGPTVGDLRSLIRDLPDDMPFRGRHDGGYSQDISWIRVVNDGGDNDEPALVIMLGE